MKTHRQIDSVLKQSDPGIDARYSVAIVRRLFIKGYLGCRAKSTDYRSRGCGYKMNFCPECGQKLTKNSAIDAGT